MFSFLNILYKKRLVDYNIEYAHIYSDQQFGREHIAAIKKTKQIINKLARRRKTYTLTVLIDEYHPEGGGLDWRDFIVELERRGLAPDYVGFESKLAGYRKLLLEVLPSKDAIKFEKYFAKRAKLMCSFLIAGWYLARLGIFPIKHKLIRQTSKKRKPFRAKKIINILDKKYKRTEDVVFRIIAKTPFKDYVKDIEQVYY